MHYPEQFQAMTCFFFKDHSTLRTKSALLRTISGDNLFFTDHCIFRTKTALLGTILFGDHWILRTEIPLPRKDFK